MTGVQTCALPICYLTKLARAYTPWCETEDLKQEAALALLDAAGRFDPAYGTKLLTYATPAIEAALSDYAADGYARDMELEHIYAEAEKRLK